MATRRQFLIGSALVAGGLAIGYRLRLPPKLPETIDLEPGQTSLTPYVVVDQSGITIITPRAEMGQGIHTTLAALVAEELEVRFEDIIVAHGPASEHYANSIFYGPRPFAGRTHGRPTQATGGQSSIRDAYVKMRKAGAAARAVLIQAAADRLGVDASTLTARDGAIVAPDGTAISYPELAEAAAAITPPQDPPLKPRSAWTLLGTSLPRIDMVEKCTGTAEFGIDVQRPGLLYGTVRRSPRLGGTMISYDATEAESMEGVVGIVPIHAGVVVVATNTWYAFEAARRITFEWGPAPYPETTAGHRAAVDAALDDEPFYVARDDGDVDTALADAAAKDSPSGTVSVAGTFGVPYVAHAPLEPMNATAVLTEDQLDVWAGNQFPTLARMIGARMTGFREEQVKIHTTYMGGGFGRRFEMDDVEAAVEAAKAFPGRPVRVTYTREEDLTHDTYRPMASARYRASMHGGRLTAIDLKLSAPSLFASGFDRRSRMTGEEESGARRNDVSITMGAKEQPYRIDHFRVSAHKPQHLLPVGWWRSVGSSQNSFFLESILDELAHESGIDPMELRLSMIEDPSARRSLEAVADMCNWGSPAPAGRVRGLAFTVFKDVPTAEVIEISRSDAGIHMHRAWCAVDVGVALDRRNIEAQVQGALGFGLSSAINGRISINDGRVNETNFAAYPLLRIDQMPSIDVRIFEDGGAIRGLGEVATAAAAPALGNAIFALTGERIRELPFGRAVRFA